MTAAEPAWKNANDPTLDLLYADVRAGYACIATFEGPGGTTWMEVRGTPSAKPAPLGAAAG